MDIGPAQGAEPSSWGIHLGLPARWLGGRDVLSVCAVGLLGLRITSDTQSTVKQRAASKVSGAQTRPTPGAASRASAQPAGANAQPNSLPAVGFRPWPFPSARIPSLRPSVQRSASGDASAPRTAEGCRRLGGPAVFAGVRTLGLLLPGTSRARWKQVLTALSSPGRMTSLVMAATRRCARPFSTPGVRSS